MSSILFDPDSIRTLATILRETALTEIELVEGDNRIRLVRGAAPMAQTATAMLAPAPAMQAPPDLASEEAAPPGAIMSPMVGVAYLAPEPGATPFIAVGRAVAAGQTVLLIEAMKTFNQIKAPQAGVVTRILVASGEPVEYDQPLLVIE
jgi:acetyl-CoA carboxylase biotin carboxyl carrier protein